jgi:AraC family transcriptional regulator
MSTALRIVHGSFGRVALLDMDHSLVRHAHPHCHLLVKVAGADTRFAVADKLVELTSRQAVLINAWEPHSYVHDGSRPRTVILALYIEPDWLARFRSNRDAGALCGNLGTGLGLGSNPVVELSARMRDCAADLAEAMLTRPVTSAMHEHLISELMIATVDRLAPWRRWDAASAPSAPIDWRIRRVMNLMREDPGGNHDTDALAREAGLSRAHFYRLFESAANVTPHVYLNVLRLEVAVSAVVNDSAPLAPLSRRLGFSAPAHFTRFFRDHTGVNPSEFRAVARLGMLAPT